MLISDSSPSCTPLNWESLAGASGGLFNHSGLAALSDFQVPLWRELFTSLEVQQADFFSKQHLFRTGRYKWPVDCLHQWSRAWEYPYVYFHLHNFREAFKADRLPKIADIGSGVTFFPFAVAQLGFDVICADPDPVCVEEFSRAVEVMNSSPGKVAFRPIASSALPFKDAECDACYCISVVEHIDDFANTVSEMARILKTGGLLYLTIDLDLQGNQAIRADRYPALINSLNQYFDFEFPVRAVHPADMLDNLRGPYPMYKISKWQKARHLLKQEIVKPLFRRAPAPLLDWHLAVEAAVLRKRL